MENENHIRLSVGVHKGNNYTDVSIKVYTYTLHADEKYCRRAGCISRTLLWGTFNEYFRFIMFRLGKRGQKSINVIALMVYTTTNSLNPHYEKNKAFNLRV